MGISEATFYNWKKRFGGLGVSEVRRLRQLEEENVMLKQIVADLSLDRQMLQYVLKESSKVCPKEEAGTRATAGLQGIRSKGM